MTEEEHRLIHVELHKSFDQLLADFIDNTYHCLSNAPIFELVEWSFEQTVELTHSHEEAQ